MLAVVSIGSVVALGIMAQRYQSLLGHDGAASRPAPGLSSSKPAAEPAGDDRGLDTAARVRARMLEARQVATTPETDPQSAERYVEAYVRVRKAMAEPEPAAASPGQGAATAVSRLDRELDAEGLDRSEYRMLERIHQAWSEGRLAADSPFTTAFESRRDELR